MADKNNDKPEIITVTPGPKAGNRVALYEKDDAHKEAGHKDGEVFISHNDVKKVARTALVESKLQSKELIEAKAEPKADHKTPAKA